MDIYDLMKQVNDAFNQRYCFSSKRKNSKRYGFTILDKLLCTSFQMQDMNSINMHQTRLQRY